ncbi:MAG: hypothetical protein ING59_17475 [Burkholderiales bacterium]|nr:hypothetical protein [Burkholderiales bacterium]
MGYLRLVFLAVSLAFLAFGASALFHGEFTAISRSGGRFIVSGSRAVWIGRLLVALGSAFALFAVGRFSERSVRYALALFCVLALVVDACAPH